MRLTEMEQYRRWGLGPSCLRRLALLGDLLMNAGFNITGIREEGDIERIHLLDSLSLLGLPLIAPGAEVVDIGSGAGLPALVLAIAAPGARVTALESQLKKASFIKEAAATLGLDNVRVCCERAEDHGRGEWRGTYDVAVSRAVAALPVVAEYSIPLLRLHGHMVAMKGAVSNEERIQAEVALGILGAGNLEAVRMDAFPGAENHWVYLAEKLEPTPDSYPRRPGMPAKRPLGRGRSRETRPR